MSAYGKRCYSQIAMFLNIFPETQSF
uniref:Uncharacterized protein n=1 Tax=Anguilla anguilla TaxID=7936 RepID=A0A0E9XS48_ANGAN